MQQETTPATASIVAPNWAEVLRSIFDDPRFEEFDLYCYSGEVDDQKIGVVLATARAGYFTFALNTGMLERLRGSASTGKVDHAFIIATRINGPSRTFCSFMTVEEVHAKIQLFGLAPLVGRFGEFFPLPRGFFPPDEHAPF